jgi:uncharacterized protein (DUF362 family)
MPGAGNKSRPAVSVVKVKDSVIDAVREAMDLAKVMDAIEPGAKVCIKPNLGFDLFFPGAITSPWVVEGVIRALKDRASEITIVESDQVLVDIEKAFKRSGMERLLKEYGVKFVNMSKGKFVDLPVKNYRKLEKIRIPEILTQATLVTVPVMKTHDKTEISGAIKNQWGCLDVLRHNYHLEIDEVLSDIHKILKPAFAVCDATVALEGDGPKTGRPRFVDRILASRDIVAIDAVSARIMGFDPEKIRHLRLLTEDGVGAYKDYEVVGEDISKINMQFQCAGHNSVSVVELAFRKSFLRKLVFDTPVLDLMCFGANIYYLIWYHIGPGGRIRDRVIKESRYGAQWR